MQKELGFSDEDLTASYAIGCAFLAVGALLLVPFALKFGRRPLYVVSSLVQFGVSIWSAKIHTVADLLLVNVFIATFGALGEVLVQMTIADVFFVHQRGRLNSLYIWLWQVSVSLGPLIAGFITKGQGWRWVWWWNAIFLPCSSSLRFSATRKPDTYILHPHHPPMRDLHCTRNKTLPPKERKHGSP